MDFYLIRELLIPFGFGVALFSALGVAVATLSDLSYKIVNSNLSVISAIEIFFLKIPEYIAYALPISLLLSTLITYSRLSSDNELIALRSTGISLFRLILPALIFSVFITGLTFIFNELIVPNSNYKVTTILVDQLNEQRRFLLRQDIFYPEYINVKQDNGKEIKELKTLFYAEAFDGETMKSVTILDTEKKQLNKVIVSERGQWNNKSQVWDLFNGVIYNIKEQPLRGEEYFFTETQIPLSKTPLELASKSRDPYEMNIVQSQEYIKLLRLLGDEKTVLMFQVRTAQKISFPFVCIIFALVGSSLGSRPNSASKAMGFGLCVSIVFGYYFIGFMIGSLGLIGVLSPFMAAWIPNILGFLIGFYLLFKPNFA
ncbi:LptF/LptG family permease [Geminocystis sp. CENA526]|uniref:LptF/LptG family permease n=1 Tax=Geminocystis sp. CENA526 TaxID=1355871 RepID=UPI003D6F6FE6